MAREMPDVLQKICATKQAEIESLREKPTDDMYAAIERQSPPRGFRAALGELPEVALIAEVKKASPSAGIIREDFVPRDIARSYQAGGARCLSVLTDETYFQGKLSYLEKVRESVDLPVLRKDFILDEYQVLEARAAGADCILLIVAAMDRPKLMELSCVAKDLKMDVLVEVHDEEEAEVAVSVGADLIGINNRNLCTFEVDLDTTTNIMPQLPTEAVCVAESGIRNREDVLRMKEYGVDAILVGEFLMRAENVTDATKNLSDV